MRWHWARIIGLLWVTAGASAAFAQERPRWVLGGDLGATTLDRVAAGTDQRLTGVTARAHAAVRLGRVSVSVGYMEGSLDSNGTVGSDLVEGEFALGLAVVPGVFVLGALKIRGVISAGTTQRSVLWEARIAARRTVISPHLTTFVEVWRVVGADVNVVEPWDRGGGVHGGLQLRIRSSPVAVRLGYRVDDGRFGDAARAETVQQLIGGVVFTF